MSPNSSCQIYLHNEGYYAFSVFYMLSVCVFGYGVQRGHIAITCSLKEVFGILHFENILVIIYIFEETK